VPPIETASWLLDTFQDANKRELSRFRKRYLSSESFKHLIASNQPLNDAIKYLEYAISTIGRIDPPGHNEPQGIVAIKALEVARNIFGEVLDDLEAEENPTLIPVWDRDAKQLWYGEILCREYRRVADAQFEILDRFQVRDWPKTVPSPWRDDKKLRDTISHMNEYHLSESPIRFEVSNMKPSWFRFRPRSGPDQLR
jgi:hypothetical protein